MRIFSNNKGATAIEYCLLASIFAITCLVAFSYMSDENSSLFNRVSSAVGSANSANE
jgi:Flp pilus assembly pilin Flp